MENNLIKEDTKKCPYCGGDIPVGAVKCKYCGEWLKGDNSHVHNPQQINVNVHNKGASEPVDDSDGCLGGCHGGVAEGVVEGIGCLLGIIIAAIIFYLLF